MTQDACERFRLCGIFPVLTLGFMLVCGIVTGVILWKRRHKKEA